MSEERDPLVSAPFATRVARWGIVAWSLIGVLILAFFVFRYVLYPIRIIFPPLLVALVIVYLLNPVVSWLERRRVRRVLGVLLTYVVFLAAVGLLLRLVVPVVAIQVSEFAKTVPALLQRMQATVADLVRRLNLDLDVATVVSQLDPKGAVGAFFSRIFSFTVGVLHVALIFVLGAVLGFYLLVDLPKIQRGVMQLVAPRRQPAVAAITERMGRALGGFFRGQLLVALFVGLASMLGLWIVGLPYWALVGMIAGLFNLIPLIGPFIGAIPALFIAFTTGSSGGLLHLTPGWPLAVGAAVALLAVQQLDNHVISPNVVARTVQLHPVTVMLGLLVGGTLLGLWGMLLAVPTIAAAKILALHYWDTKMQWPPAPGEVPTIADEAQPPPQPSPGETPPIQARREDRERTGAEPGRATGWLRRRRAGEEQRERQPANPGS